MTKIEWTSSAVRDVKSLRDYIAQDSEWYADRFAERVIQAVENLAAYPLMGRKVLEADEDAIREIFFRRYRIMYRVETPRILVLMVIQGGRDLTQINPKPWEIL